MTHFINNAGSDWLDKLPHIIYTLNTSTHSTTNHSAFFLMFGYNPRAPQDIRFTGAEIDKDIVQQKQYLNSIRKELPKIFEEKTSQWQKYYDRRRRPDVKYEKDELVLIKDHIFSFRGKGKMAPRYLGPYRVL